MNTPPTENELSNTIIGLALKIHRHFGPGLLESVYEECLYYELIAAGLSVDQQWGLPLVYKEVKLECGYRVDLLVEKKVVIEIKSVENLT